MSACKQIAHDVNKGALIGVLGSAGSENVQGETQKKLDIITNEVFIKANEWSGHLAAMASEEMDDIYPIPAQYPKGKYLITFDPLDGSSNIDVNISVGTIFSILRCPEGVTNPTAADFMQPGTKQICAGYALYGPNTMIVITTGHGVNGFTLDRDVGDFFLTHPDMQIPEDTAEFAINMSNQRFWEEPVQRYVEECVKGKDGGREKNFNMRWVASMVAEVHRILTRGGIFMYPFDTKDRDQAGQAAPDVRSQSDVVHRRTGWRRELHRTRAHHGIAAHGPASTCAGHPRLEERSRARGWVSQGQVSTTQRLRQRGRCCICKQRKCHEQTFSFHRDG